MSEVSRPDLCIVGAGAAGLSVAAIAASFGVPVVLVEKGRMGGECLNVGCVPSKALIAAGERAQTMREAAPFGLEPVEPSIAPERVRDHVREVIASIAPNDSVERFRAMGVNVIQGEARFTDARTLVVEDATIQARRFVIASGSRPAMPGIEGLDRVEALTNETVFDLAERPRHLIVVGGGPIGVEIAQAHRRLGGAVTILEADRILSREDPEMAAVVERALLAEGVILRQGVRVERVAPADAGVAVTIRAGQAPEEVVEGSHLFVAVGRSPVVEGLGLDAAGVAHDPSGIVVDRGLRTSNRRIYALGDCIGGPLGGYRFTHAANHQAGLVIRSALFRLPVRLDQSRIPRVTFTDPELAVVGLSEEEARARHRAIRVLRWPVAENDRAQAERRTRGHLKAVVATNGRVLGCAIAAPQAGELITPWTLALAKGLKVQDLAGIVVPYPTLSEVTKRAAVEFLKPAAQNTWLRGLIGLARRLG